MRLFVEVVQGASFTAAAKSRGVPVSTVSRRIARLESALGTVLLERTTRKLHLTDAGRGYFDHAERGLGELAEGVNGVRSLQTEPRGTIRLTAPIAIGPAVTSALAPFLAANPHVTADVDLTDRRVDLLAERFDIAIRAGSVDSPDFVAKQLFASTRGLFASGAYLRRRGRPRRIADLAKHDLIATRSTARGAVWDLASSGGRARPFTFTPRLVVNELLAARAAAAAGGGIAFLPDADMAGDDLERVLPAVSGAPSGMWLLYPARRSVTAAVRACVAHLRASIGR